MKYKAVILTSMKVKITLGLDADTLTLAKKQLQETIEDDYRHIYISTADIFEASNPKNLVHYAIGWFEAIRRCNSVYGKY